MNLYSESEAKQQGFEIIPGVQQLWDGTMFRHATKGRESIMVKYAPEIQMISDHSKRMMEKVEVESLAYPVALSIVPQTEKQAKMLRAIIESGPTYTSIRLFQGRNY